jgi:hypothetical protein
MEGFKSNPKMKNGVACYKEGGAVYKSRHSEKTEKSEDIAKDKKIVKKAFSMHDKQSHEGESTDLSKLRKGGRIKKADGGNVRKYKAGGNVKKMANGGMSGQGAVSDHEREMLKRSMGRGMVTEEEAARMPKGPLPQEMTDAMARKQNMQDREMIASPMRKLKEMLGGGKAKAPSAAMGQGAVSDKESALSNPMKKGGMVKKCAEGGSLKAVDAEKNPGLSKLPTDVRNNMGYAKSGGKVKKRNMGGSVC